MIEPTFTAHLYQGLHEQLMEMLRGLAPDDWTRPTVCRDWQVRDIAAHILDTQTRTLSLLRDRLPLPSGPLSDYASLVKLLNDLNADWVKVMRRASPSVLVDLLGVTGPQQAEYYVSLDPHTPALLPVAWAGDAESPNWFHIGRDYTEYWHHQQQIREAVGAPLLAGREWLRPALEIFVRALPVTYRDTAAAPGQTMNVVIGGEGGGSWRLLRQGHAWELFEGVAQSPAATVHLSDDTAWRIFTKGLSREEASRRVMVEGDTALGAVFLGTLAIMA
jgi:uncharacterized protein (TIGR03083 family)